MTSELDFCSKFGPAWFLREFSTELVTEVMASELCLPRILAFTSSDSQHCTQTDLMEQPRAVAPAESALNRFWPLT